MTSSPDRTAVRDALLAAMKEVGLSKTQLALELARRSGAAERTVRRYINRWTSKKRPVGISRQWADLVGEVLDQPAGWLRLERHHLPVSGGGAAVEPAATEDLEQLRGELGTFRSKVERRLARIEVAVRQPAGRRGQHGRG